MNSRSGTEAIKSMYGCLVLCVQGEDGVEKLLQIAASYDNGANNANGDGAALFVATTGIQAQDLKLLLLDGERYVESVYYLLPNQTPFSAVVGDNHETLLSVM